MILRLAWRVDDATEARGTALVDWRGAFTAECGLHAARDLQRRQGSSATTPARATAAPDRAPDDPARGLLALTTVTRRWIPSQRC